MTISRIGLLAALAFAPACALLSKSDPMTPRYFSPETEAPPDSPGKPSTTDANLEVHLGRIESDAFIEDRLIHRDSADELGYYDGRAWTEKPTTYVRRALDRALFDAHGVRQIVSGPATTLDVRLIAFEEVRKPVHVGRVELAFRIVDDRSVRVSRTIVVERPIPDGKGDAEPDAIVNAIGEALVAAVGEIASATVTELRAESQPTPGTGAQPPPVAQAGH